jgi:hypothetical protein
LEVFLRVTYAVVALLPKFTWIGETSNLESSTAASKMESVSTGEEDVQAAAIAAHTMTTMAARSARLTNDFT